MDISDGNENYPILRFIGQLSDNTFNLYTAFGKKIPKDLSSAELLSRIHYYERPRIEELSRMSKEDRTLVVKEKLKKNNLGWIFRPHFIDSFVDWELKITDEKVVWIIMMIRDLERVDRIREMNKEVTLEKIINCPEETWIDIYRG